MKFSILKVRRYGAAISGPVLSAAIQFAISFALLKSSSPEQFGTASFMLVLVQLTISVSSALFCAPLSHLIANEKSLLLKDQFLGAMAVVNRLYLLGIVFLAVVASAFIEIGAVTAILYTLYVLLNLSRWFGRAVGYATKRNDAVFFSDLGYSATAGIILATSLYLEIFSVNFAWLIMSAGSAFGLLVLYRPLKLPTIRSSIIKYKNVWEMHSRWSLIGVLSTESTANAHSYAVTFIFGPAAFAPIAATSLLLRPIQIVMNALSESERAQMSEAIAERDMERANHALKIFNFLLISVCIIVILFSFLLIGFMPELVFSSIYSLSTLYLCTFFWSAISVVRCVRTPWSVFLQAAGSFKQLGFASVYSAIVSIFSVILLTLFFSPVFSLGGVLIAEALLCFMIFIVFRKTHFKKLRDAV